MIKYLEVLKLPVDGYNTLHSFMFIFLIQILATALAAYLVHLFVPSLFSGGPNIGLLTVLVISTFFLSLWSLAKDKYRYIVSQKPPTYGRS